MHMPAHTRPITFQVLVLLLLLLMVVMLMVVMLCCCANTGFAAGVLSTAPEAHAAVRASAEKNAGAGVRMRKTD